MRRRTSLLLAALGVAFLFGAHGAQARSHSCGKVTSELYDDMTYQLTITKGYPKWVNCSTAQVPLDEFDDTGDFHGTRGWTCHITGESRNACSRTDGRARVVAQY
jgi:hypothetical protein